MSGREVVLAVSGGIAAYKSAALASLLVQRGLRLSVVMTAAAERFVGTATFAALSGRAVARELFDETQYPLGAHIALADRGSLLVVAPATADILSKTACGAADDLLSTLYLCFGGPVLMAPAMNVRMWNHPAVMRNVRTLREDGVEFIDPDEGWLSCRQQGAGRMAAPERICAAVEARLATLGD